MYCRIRYSILLLLLISFSLEAQQKDMNVLEGNWLEYSDAANSLYHHLTGLAYRLLDERENKVSQLQTLADWQERQKKVSETLTDILGPFPEKSPLNARVVRTIDKGTFRIEHIIYESLPGFCVTSSLYIPAGLKRNKKTPAVIYCSGHSVDGYRSAVYQHVIINLVHKGFIVFAFDPVGQGERLEYFDEKTGKSIIGGPTMEHSYPGAQAFLTGSSQAFYMIWDGIRAVDYLITRKEVDPARIGITGRSGGGTQSAYIAAYDDRIYAAAPENYLTNYRRLLQTIGPQDAEQNLFNIIARGLDHPDFLIVRAPKPALMITTTRDMFSIQGAMETGKEVSGIYKAYGVPENFSRVEDDTVHASTVKNREAMYAFFQKFLNNPGNPVDEVTETLTKEELQVTQTGQVSTSLHGETVFTINRKRAEELDKNLESLRKNPSAFIPEAVTNAKRLSGYIEPAGDEEPVFTGRLRRGHYSIEKYFVKGEGNYPVPYLLFRPEKPSGKVMIYLHPSGKLAEAQPGGEIEKFVSQGITVLAPDMINTGETGEGALQGDAYFKGSSHNMWYASMLVGRTITGIQAGDVIRLVDVVKKNFAGAYIIGLAHSTMAPVLLHAAAFCQDIGAVILVQPYSSYMSIAVRRFYDPGFILSSVPGALQYYDLPDLAASIAPRRLVIVNPVNGEGKPSGTPDIHKDLDLNLLLK
jgi:dienelactone hydrolase